MPCLSLASPIHFCPLPTPTISCSDLTSSHLSYHHIPHSISLPTFASTTILYNFLSSHSLSHLTFLPSHCPTLPWPACLTPSSKSNITAYLHLTFDEIHLASPNPPPHPSSLLPTVISLALPCNNIPFQYNRIAYHSPLTPYLRLHSLHLAYSTLSTHSFFHLTSLTLPYLTTIPYPRLS